MTLTPIAATKSTRLYWSTIPNSRCCCSRARSLRAASRTASSPRTALFPPTPIPSISRFSASSPAAGRKARPPSALQTSRPHAASWSSPRCASAPWSTQDQQQVWDSVHGAMSQMEVAAAPPASAGVGRPTRGCAADAAGHHKLRQSDAESRPSARKWMRPPLR